MTFPLLLVPLAVTTLAFPQKLSPEEAGFLLRRGTKLLEASLPKDQASVAFISPEGKKCVLEHKCRNCVTRPEVALVEKDEDS